MSWKSILIRKLCSNFIHNVILTKRLKSDIENCYLQSNNTVYIILKSKIYILLSCFQNSKCFGHISYIFYIFIIYKYMDKQRISENMYLLTKFYIFFLL